MSNFLDFKKVILHNFGSYGHAEVDLKNRGFCLVSGQNNYKKDNALSNGSGKSFIWSAICFTITGETLSGLHSNLKNINIDENSCYTQLVFSVNNDEYELTRYVEPKSDLKIVKNGEDVSGKTFRESEKKLGDLLPELNKDLIASTILIGQGMPNKFSSFSPSGRKELLENLTGTDFMIDEVKTKIQNRQTELEGQVRALEDSFLLNGAKLSEAIKQRDAAQKEIDEAVKPDFDTLIKQGEDQLNFLDGELKRLKEAKDKKGDEADAANEELVNITKEKTTLVNELFKQYQTNIGPVRQEKLEAETTIRNLQTEVARLKNVKDVCPTCGQKLPNAVKPDTSKQEAEIKRLTESLPALIARVNEVEQKKANYEQQLKEEFDQKEIDASNKAKAVRKEFTDLINAYNDCSQNYYTENANLQKLKTDKANWDAHQKALAQKVKDLNKTINDLTNIQTLTDTNRIDLNEHQAVVKKMDSLAKRDFRGYLLANIIAYLDKKAKDYSEIVFETRDLNVYLDGNALDISYCGKMFDNLSGGEKQRVDLILQFAIRDMLNVYLNSSANILVLDEITDFLDKTSCAAVMKLIEKELNTIESVFIVSHHADSLEIPIDSEIKVIKDTEGISSIN
ncbi:MAG: hypothetical protein J6X03_02990 [Bacilli bacterium]|nr:hypothetical protein [Bacilli bacterium]